MKKCTLLALLLIPVLALAQVVVPTPDDPGAFLAFLLTAVQTKQWVLVGMLATMGLVALAKKIGTKYVPWLGTRRGGALLALIGGLAVALVEVLLTSKSLSASTVIFALLYGPGAAGIWTMARRLIYGDGVVEVPAQPAVAVSAVRVQ